MCANQGSQNLLGKKLEKDGGKQALGKLQSGLLETADADQRLQLRSLGLGK